MTEGRAARAAFTLQCLLLVAASVCPAWGRQGAAAAGASRPAGKRFDAGWIKVEQGPAFELFDNSDETEVRIPVTLAQGLSPEEVSLRLVDLRYGKRYDPSLLAAFKVPPTVADAPGLGPAITVTVALKTASAQGGYGLLIEAAARRAAAPQLLAVEIVHPTAKLRAVETVVVEQTLHSFPFLTQVVEGAPLLLVEDSGNTRMTGISIRPLAFYGAANQPNKGSLSFKDVPPQLGPRGSHSQTYQLDGDFPLGTVKGSALITSPQLADPILVNFEVHTRRASWLLFVIIGAGLLLGYISRTALRLRIQLNEARKKGHDFVDHVGVELGRYPDEDFQAQARKIVDGLRPVLAGRDAAAITSAVQTANDALRARLKELEERRLAAQRQLDLVSAVTDRAWDVPEKIRAPLDVARAAKEKAEGELRVDEIKSAATKLGELPATLGRALEAPVSDWKRGTTARLNALTVGGLLPRVLAERVKPDVDTLRPLIAAVPVPDSLSTTENIRKSLRAVHDARKTAEEFVKLLATAVAETAAAFDATLRQAKVPVLPALDRLKEAASALSDELLAQSARPEEALEALTAERLLLLKKAWQEALIRQTALFNASEKEAVTKLSDEGDYLRAAERVARVLAGMAGGGTLGKHSAGLASAAQEAATAAGRLAPHRESETMTGGVPSVIRVQELPPRVEGGRVRTLRQLATDKLLQTVFAGALITLAGYVFFEPKFVGTFADIVTAFFWGFSLDVTMDTLLELRPKAGAA